MASLSFVASSVAIRGAAPTPIAHGLDPSGGPQRFLAPVSTAGEQGAISNATLALGGVASAIAYAAASKTRRSLSRSCAVVACQATPVAQNTGKPSSTTLYTKAGPEGTSLGDCPFSHSVQTALTLKGVKYEVVPCTQETKPQWLLDEVGGKMPCVCHDGVPHVETSEILAWIDQEFPEPPLAVTPETVDAVKGFGLFPAIAGYTKSTDASTDDELRAKLEAALGRLNGHLEATPGGFLAGERPSLVDCDVFPKLYVLTHATSHFKGFKLEDLKDGDAVRAYLKRCSELPAFVAGAYPADVCIWGWRAARGE